MIPFSPAVHRQLRVDAGMARPMLKFHAAMIPTGLRWTLYLFMFSIPFEMPQRTIPIELPTVTAFIFLLTRALTYRRWSQQIPSALPYFCVYLHVALASAIYQDRSHPGDLIWRFLQVGMCVLLFWSTYRLFQSDELRTAAGLSLVVGCVLRATVQLLGEGGPVNVVSGARTTAFAQDPNNATGILSVALIGLAGLMLQRGLNLKLLLLLVLSAIGALSMAILQMASRGGMIALVTGLMCLLFRPGSASMKLRNALVVLVLLGVFLGVALQFEVVRARFESTLQNDDFAGRENIYPHLLDMFREKPWIGWGLLDNEYELGSRILQLDPSHVYIRRDSHNTLLDVMTSTGFVGLAPFAIGVILCVRGAWNGRSHPHGAIPIAVLAAVIAMSMSVGWIASKLAWVVLSYALASAGMQRRRCPQPAHVRIF